MRKIFAVTALIISSHTYAQDTTRIMEEVTLTASKHSIKTTETGKVVTIITRQQLEKAGSRDLAQVITEMGGIFINGYSSNAGKEKNIYLRGAKVEHTLITIDGVPVYDASGIGSNFDIRNLAVDNVERIEILKGSQGTLYGSDAIAGVINIITKKPGSTEQPPAVTQVMHYGSFNTFRSGTTVSGKKKWLGYTLGLSHTSTDGFSEAEPLQAGQPAFEKDGYRQNNLHAQFHIPVRGKLQLQPFFRYNHFKGDLDLDAGRDEKDYTNTNSNLQGGLRSILHLGKGQLNMLYQYIHTKRSYRDDSLYMDPYAYYIFNLQHYRSSEHFGEVFFVQPWKQFRLTAGADIRKSATSYHAIQNNVFSPALMEESFDADSVHQQQYGIYAALHFSKKNLNIEAGGRWNHHSAYGSNAAFNFNPSYLVNRHVKIFANLSTGYKTPSLYQLFSTYGNTALDPETSLNIEGGIQLFSKTPSNYIRFTYFNRKVNDLIAFVSIAGPPYAQYVNQDEQADHGIEIELAASVQNKWQFRGFFNYVDGAITTKMNGKDTSYFNLLRRPTTSMGLFTGWQATEKLSLHVQMNLIGERKDIYFDPVSFQSVDISLDPYFLLNFQAEYHITSAIRLFGDVRNVLDKRYMDIYGYNTPGINAYGGLRVKF